MPNFDARIEELQDALEKALEAGLSYKANAEEGAKRVEQAERRIYELEKNKELFQTQRDEAIRERDRARQICDRVLKSQQIPAQIERLSLSAGELVIFRLVKDATKDELEAFSGMIRWLKRYYPTNTFITFANMLEIEVETLHETELRQMGLILACRVDAGIQQLEAAFGAQQAAIRKCRQLIVEEVSQARPDSPSEREQYLAQLLDHLDKLISAELKPEERPTRETLIELLHRCRNYLVWNTDGDTNERPASIELDAALTAAIGPERPDDDGLEGA